MTSYEISEPEVLFSVAEVARLMNVSIESVRDAVRRKRLQAEAILVGDRIGVSIPLSAVAECWNLSQATVNEIETDAQKGTRKARVAIVTPLFLRGGGVGGVSVRPTHPSRAESPSCQRGPAA